MTKRTATRKSLSLGLIMLVAAGLALVLAPHPVATTPPPLEQNVPHQFGDWREVPTTLLSIGVENTGEDATERNDILYDQILSRTYVNSRGEQIMLALAYGERQRQEYKVHRPEVCYTAQGFQIVVQSPTDFGFSAPSGARVTGRQLLAHSSERFEAVSYWIRLGDIYSVNAWQARWYIFVEGLRGRVQDGILVRASQIVTRPAEAEFSYATQRQFLRELTQALPPLSRELLLR